MIVSNDSFAAIFYGKRAKWVSNVNLRKNEEKQNFWMKYKVADYMLNLELNDL